MGCNKMARAIKKGDKAADERGANFITKVLMQAERHSKIIVAIKRRVNGHVSH